MTSVGILGFLARHFKAPAEVVATEGLCYLLQRHEVARDAVVAALATELVTRGPRQDLLYQPGALGRDTGIVDLEGRVRVRGRPLISIEGKLSAPLQDTQPVGYAERLQDGGALLFVCPVQRVGRLRGILCDRVRDAQMLADSGGWKPDPSGIEWVAMTGSRRLGITSWTLLLSLIKDGAGTMPPELGSDIHQLEDSWAGTNRNCCPGRPKNCSRKGSASRSAKRSSPLKCFARPSRTS